ncbi:flippase [Deinococcus sp. VB343]|uniref:flippase n=1 Tax=Deinococcus sp. VB343 TaxID=3385567 RepID=UPI0039C9BA9F
MLRTIFYLGGVQLANLLLPLIMLPFLSRKLGPTSLGQLVAVQSLFITLSMIVEYGFAFSGTRTLSTIRSDIDRSSRLVADVLGAKIILSVIYIFIAILIYFTAPVFNEHPSLYFLGVIFGIVQGINPLWFFQGVEKLKAYSLMDISGRLLGFVLTLLYIRQPGDNWKVLMFQSLGFFLSLSLSYGFMYRITRFVVPDFKGSLLALNDGKSMFIYKIIVSIYTTLNSTILRFFVPAAQVAYYSNADRIASAGKGAIGPITQVVFPRIAFLLPGDRKAAKDLFLRTLVLMAILCLFIAGFLYITSDWLVVKFLGKEFFGSVPAFKILCWSIPFVGISAAIGFTWLIPNSQDNIFNTIILIGAISNVLSLFYFIPHFGYIGMAWGVLLTEIIITLSLISYTFFIFEPNQYRLKENYD